LCWRDKSIRVCRREAEKRILVAPVFPAKGNFTKIGPFSETSPARTQLPDLLRDLSSWPEGPPWPSAMNS
jgi:hypothetical protein